MKNRKMSLRPYITFISIITLCCACLISCSIVVVGAWLFYHGPITLVSGIIMCFLACILSMISGGITLYIIFGRLLKPIEELNPVVNEIAEGNFNVRIERDERKKGSYLYANELDELAANVNKMAEELSSMDYMRKDFMSNVSHEIKTPVAAITSVAELLLDELLEEQKQKEYLTLIYQEARRLSILGEDMLQMSHLDHKKIVVRNDKVRVDEQLRRAVILLSQKWSESGHKFDLNFCEAVVESDKSLMMQVWINLIDNAMKYSPINSTIHINEYIKENKLIVSFQDEGIGIENEKMSKIFDKFYQCEESHKKQGSGLGLSIVKRILELLGGEIHYESEKNIGTTAIVEIWIYK
ncbi:HAMP domain-containing sensor histidine kinase [Pectinatus haikarae]|uniref:Heme sensor protein HssS n=1 Tax=Pectinatus haikarae TaxID=349096 RepID=A0ABT9YB41_9FIRM|nr:HAMP domain-containing sensor histidine kinase [Pectinatus haikarae]MDQ0204939.1 signal transduction histidine kinase [Pectinatus haikarae]